MMNKNRILVLAVLGVFLFAGCATVYEPPPSSSGTGGYDPEYWSEKEDQAAQIILGDSQILYESYQTAREIVLPFNKYAAFEDVAEVYLGRGQYDKAAMVVDTIANPEVRYLALVHIADKAWQDGNEDQALQYLAQAVAVADTITVPHPQASAYITIAGRYIEYGQRTTAIGLLDKATESTSSVSDDRIRAYDYTRIGDYYAKAQEKQKAGQVLTEAHDIATGIDSPDQRVTALDMIAAVLAEDGQFDKAFEIIEEIEDAATQGAAPDRIVDIYMRLDQYPKAVATAQSIKITYTRVFTLIRIAERAWDEGKINLAEQVLADAVTTAETIEDQYQKEAALARLGKTYLKFQQPDPALAIAGRIEDQPLRFELLETISAAYAQSGDFATALQVADTNLDPYHKTLSLVHIAREYANREQWGKSIETLDLALVESERIVQVPTWRRKSDDDDTEDQERRRAKIDRREVEYLKDVARAKIAEGYAQARMFDKALEVTGTISDLHSHDTALYWIAHWYVAGGRYHEALQTKDSICDPYYRASVLKWVADKMSG